MIYHFNLANYFASKPLYLDESTQKKPNTRKLVEQPWQQTKGEMWDEVTATLSDLYFIQSKSVAKMTYELVNDIRRVLDLIPDNAAHIREDQARQARLDKYILDLIDCAGGKIPLNELEIIESITPWTEDQKNAEIERIKTNPNRADILKDFLNFIGIEAYNLQTYGGDFLHFAIQQAWNYASDGPVGRAAESLPATVYKNLILLNSATRPQWKTLPKVLKILQSHSGYINALALSINGTKLISGSWDYKCIIWDINSGKPEQFLEGHTSGINAVSMSADNNLAISSSEDNTCIIWDLRSYAQIKTLKGHNSSINTVTLSADGKLAITGSNDNTCKVWDLINGNVLLTLKGHNDSVKAIALSVDKKIAISGSSDHTCKVWDLKSGNEILTLKGHTSGVNSVALSADCKLAISGSDDNNCIVWDVNSGNILQTLIGHKGRVRAVSLSADGKLGISGSMDNTCIVWDISKGKELQTLKKHNESVFALAFSPDGKNSISGSDDLTCIFWDIAHGEEQKIYKGHTNEVSAINFTPDGNLVVSSSWDKTCLLWDPIKGEIIKSFGDHKFEVSDVAISADGNRVVSSSWDKTCIVWDIFGKKLLTFMRHTAPVTAIALSPDGTRVISFSNDKSFILWDINTGDIIQTYDSNATWVNTAVIMADGKKVIFDSNDTSCCIYDLNTEILNWLNGHNSYCRGIASSPNGKLAISGSDDKTCILWDLSTKQKLKILNKHTESIFAVALTSDSKRAITGSLDKICFVWDLKDDKPLAVYFANSAIKTLKTSQNNIVLGCKSGEVIFLTVAKELLHSGISITTIRKIWDFEFECYQEPSADCPYCGHRFTPPDSVFNTIEVIKKIYDLQPHQSPCMDLPEEAWEEPGLLGTCPECGEELKFNPFVVGGEDVEITNINSTIEDEIGSKYKEQIVTASLPINTYKPNPFDIIKQLIQNEKYREAIIELNALPKKNISINNTLGYCFLQLKDHEKALDFFREIVGINVLGYKENVALLYKRNYISTLVLLGNEFAYNHAIKSLDSEEIQDEKVQELIGIHTKWKNSKLNAKKKLPFFKRMLISDDQLKVPIVFDFPIGELDI